MNSKYFFSMLVSFMMSLSIVMAQTVTERFQVSGNCGMCKSKIEKAAYDKLHGCCKYERSAATTPDCCKGGTCTEANKKDCCKDGKCTASSKKEDCCKDGKCKKDAKGEKSCCTKS